VALILTRQALPTLDRARYASAAGVAKGAYVLADPSDGAPDVLLLASGSEVSLCVSAIEPLAAEGIRARVVSMPFMAGLCHDTYSAHQGVEHDDMNVLVLGGRVIGEALARELVLAFTTATFTNEERHQRRLVKVRQLEEAL
jgi:transketolase